MLQRKCLNQVLATDTYFAIERLLGGYNFAHYFFGMTSMSLLVTRMKTESKFPDVYSAFI
jgi:hypothetical protein